MKRRNWWLAMLTAVWLLPLSSVANESNRESDRQQLRSMLAEIEKGINTRTIEMILPHLENNVVVTYQNAEVAHGVDAVKAYNARMMEGPNPIVKNLTTTAAISSPAIFYGDTAVAYGTSVDEFDLTGGAKFQLNGVWSATLTKRDGRWRAAAIHFSTNLFDNPLLNGAKRLSWILGIVGVVLGLAIGFYVARRRSA